jgi:hypothetical protein
MYTLIMPVFNSKFPYPLNWYFNRNLLERHICSFYPPLILPVSTSIFITIFFRKGRANGKRYWQAGDLAGKYER